MALHGNDGMELRLGTGFQSEVELLSMGNDFFYHGLHLVDLYGVYHEVLTLVVIFLRCFLEAAGSLFYPVVEDVGETQQHRRCDIAQRQLVHHLAQVYLGVVLAGCYIHVSFVVDAEIGCAPSVDVVQLFRVLNGPFLHFCVC